MIRVLQVTTLPLAMRVFILPLAQALTGLGYQVELAYGGPEPWAFDPFPHYHVALSRSPVHPLNARGLCQLACLMRSRRYDAVHVHTPVAGAVGRVAARIARVPLVMYTLHGSFWGTQPRWRAALFDGPERALAPWTSHVFVLNDDDARDVRNRCHLAPEDVTRLPVGGTGVDLAAFDPCLFPPGRVAELRQELGLETADVVVGYVGRLDRDKGIQELLLAFSQLRAADPRMRLLLVGDRFPGDRHTLSDDLLARLGPSVICPGFCDDVPAMVACMDLVVSASRRDGFGMLLAEAAAMGKPVVATRTRGARAAVVDGVTGVLVPIGDVAALSRGMQRLLADDVARVHMGCAARQRAVERFDRRRVIEIYCETYARLLA